MRKFLVGILCLIGLGVAGFYYHKINKPQYAKVPLYYPPDSDIPALTIEIASKKYRVELDSGDTGYLTLQERVLDQLHDKEECGVRTTMDMHGNHYEKPQYLLPRLQVSNFKRSPILVDLEDPFFLMNGGYIKTPDPEYAKHHAEQTDGRIGIGAFHELCLFIDLSKSIMYIARDQLALQKEKDFSIQGFIETPIVSDHLVIIEIALGNETKRMVLDTGMSVSLWKDASKPSLTPFIETLSLNGVELGSQKFRTYNLPEGLETDGILGVDFLKKHAVFIDLKNQKAYIGPEKDL